MKNFVRLNKNEMKMVMGGFDEEIDEVGDGAGDTCKADNLGLCGANCQTPRGAAAKCGTNASGKCTCGSM